MRTTPTMPHKVEVATVMRKSAEVEIRAATGVGAEGRHVVARHRLRGRRQQRLNIDLCLGAIWEMVAGWNSTFQSEGGDPESAMSLAGALPSLLTTRVMGVAEPASAEALERSPAGEAELGLAGDLHVDLGFGRSAVGRGLHRHRIIAGGDRGRRRHLDLEILVLPGLDRDQLSSCVP